MSCFSSHKSLLTRKRSESMKRRLSRQRCERSEAQKVKHAVNEVCSGYPRRFANSQSFSHHPFWSVPSWTSQETEEEQVIVEREDSSDTTDDDMGDLGRLEN